MLKRMSLRKIMVASLALFALFLLYLMPDSDNDVSYKLSNNNIEYTYSNVRDVVYLLDSNNYVARTFVDSNGTLVLEKVKNVLNSLIVDGSNSDKLPNGFIALIPSGTEVLNLDLKDGVLTVNFSREFFDVSLEYEDKMIESIVYSLTSIDGVDKVIIKVDGNYLKKLPNSGKIINTVLDKHYGINKRFDIIFPFNVDSYTVYYVGRYNDNEYYVPVTKYINSSDTDKIKLIINELSSSPIYESNLVSFLNSNVSLIDYKLDKDVLRLNFNQFIYGDNGNDILEEVIYAISLSVNDNYNLKEVIFEVNNKEICKKSLKSIE